MRGGARAEWAICCVLLALLAAVSPVHAAPGADTAFPGADTALPDADSAVPAVGVATTPAGAAPVPRVVDVEDLDVQGPWRIDNVKITGVDWWNWWVLRSTVQTKERSFWAFWRDDPELLPGVLQEDVKALRREVQAKGYYEAEVHEEVTVLADPVRAKGRQQDGRVDIVIDIELGQPVRVCRLDVDFGPLAIAKKPGRLLRESLPLRVGDIFAQADYQAAASALQGYFRERGYAESQVVRTAQVHVPTHCAQVAYTARPGAASVFGKTTIEGLVPIEPSEEEKREAKAAEVAPEGAPVPDPTPEPNPQAAASESDVPTRAHRRESFGALVRAESIDEEIVRRELTFRAGERFDERKVNESIRRLRELHLFSLVRLREQPAKDGSVPMRLELAPGPHHEIRLGVGYSTDDGPRGIASWWDYNFLGDARQLGFSLRASQINRRASASFIQPYFPGPRGVTRVDFNLGQQDESTYLDNYASLVPAVEWSVAPRLKANAFFGLSYDSLSSVTPQTIDFITKGNPEDFQKSGFTNAFGFGFRWTSLDDPLNPTDGWTFGLSPEVAGGILGGDFDHFRLAGTMRAYRPLAGKLIGVLGVRAASIVPFGDTDQVPLWARLYAGGLTAFPVRGYARRRVGPLSASDDPVGGRSVVVASVEVRHPIVDPIWGVLFVDTGDVELSAWTVDPSNFQTGVGAGLRANTPIGPVELDLGFGLNRRGDDSLVQVHFVIGPEF